MYKLVAIDCDGTLLTDSKELTERTINTIKKASFKDIIKSSKDYTDEYWFENLNLRGDYKTKILLPIQLKHNHEIHGIFYYLGNDYK